MAAPRPGSMRARALGGARPAPSREAGPQQYPQKQPYDPGRAPAGYDQDYWGMAVLFRDLAMKDVSLHVGPPVIYGELRRVFGWFGLEHGSRAFQTRGDGTVEKTFAQVYRDGDGKALTWVQVGYAIIEEFWSRVWDDAALSWFCNTDVFEQMATRVCERWLSERHAARLATCPAPEPEALAWNRDGHKRRRARAGE